MLNCSPVPRPSPDLDRAPGWVEYMGGRAKPGHLGLYVPQCQEVPATVVLYKYYMNKDKHILKV